MSDFVNFSDLFRRARDEAMVRNGKLTRDVVERPGTDANILLAGGAAAADQVVSQLIQVESGLFLDSARDQALDRLVFDRYGLVRNAASPAIGEVNFATTASNPSPFTILSGTLLQAIGGVQFITTAAVLFPASTTGPIIAPVRSVLAGSDQQANANTITSITSQIVGQPADLKVNNPLATAGADDAESDSSLRARARQFFVTARRGTISAIEQGALAVPGVRTAKVFEVLDGSGHPNRLVQLVISDAFTVSLASYNPTPATYAAQSQVLAAQVFSGLADVRAAGIFVQVVVAQVILLPVILNLTFAAGADIPSVVASAKSVTVNYVNSLQPGLPFVPGDLGVLLRGVSGLFVSGNEVASPPGDVIPLTLQALRTSMELVTVGNC